MHRFLTNPERRSTRNHQRKIAIEVGIRSSVRPHDSNGRGCPACPDGVGRVTSTVAAARICPRSRRGSGQWGDRRRGPWPMPGPAGIQAPCFPNTLCRRGGRAHLRKSAEIAYRTGY
jgi:hypothetical protein